MERPQAARADIHHPTQPVDGESGPMFRDRPEPYGSWKDPHQTASGPKDKNEEIADLLVGLTEASKTLGFGLCSLH